MFQQALCAMFHKVCARGARSRAPGRSCYLRCAFRVSLCFACLRIIRFEESTARIAVGVKRAVAH